MATITRRTVLHTTALATTLLTAPFVRGVHAAGKLSVGFWDHWVPGANEPLERLCRRWADTEKVDLKVDFITSNGDKDLLTVAAEAQAKTGTTFKALLPGMRRVRLKTWNRLMTSWRHWSNSTAQSVQAQRISASRMASGAQFRPRSAA